MMPNVQYLLNVYIKHIEKSLVSTEILLSIKSLPSAKSLLNTKSLA